MKKLLIIAVVILTIGLIGIGLTYKNAGTSIFSFNTVTIEQEKLVNGKDFKEFMIDTASTDVSVTQNEGEDIIIRLDGSVSKKLKDNYSIVVEENGDQLRIYTKAKNKTRLYIGIQIVNLTLNVSVPAKYYEQLDIKTSSGEINVEDIKSNNANFHSSSGEIEIYNIKVDDRLAISASSGEIDVNSSEVNRMNLSASSGYITIEDVNGTDTEISTSSGDVTAKNIKGDMVTNTSSGSITINNDQVMGNIQAKASSGNVNVSFEETPQSLAIRFRGSSGSAKINMDGISYDRNEKNDVIGSIGSGEYTLDVRTSSGKFRLN